MRHKANIPTHRAQCLVCRGSKEAQLVIWSPCGDEFATLSRLSSDQQVAAGVEIYVSSCGAPLPRGSS